MLEDKSRCSSLCWSQELEAATAKVDAKTDFFVSTKRGQEVTTESLLPINQDTHTHPHNGHTKSSRHLRTLEKRSFCMFVECIKTDSN